ncbi:MAG: T9SS type A sorting domain-containing protein [Bacteroidales bacterium]|jgi:hypothetical protein|nr:T9SS type A sorting domain-containing protein [Bacteroidales bacterium]
MKKIIILLICSYTLNFLNAQNMQEIILETPIIDSTKIDSTLFFIGISREYKIDCLDSIYSYVSNGIWHKKIHIQSTDAKIIKVVFEKLSLSQNAEVVMFSDKNNYEYNVNNLYNNGKSYISDFFIGDNCIIEINIPINELNKNNIVISKIKHFTKNTFPSSEKSSNSNYDCMIDVNCSEGNEWCNQKRSVAIYYFEQDNANYLCTGVLVNNYRNNFAQYFLTARHCTNGNIDWANTEFYFNYQNSNCNSDDGFTYPYFRVQGSQIIGYCDVSWSDNALLLITQPIPIQYNVYFSGVDTRDRDMGDDVTCIHHSDGLPKKITSGEITFHAGAKWDIYWDNGIIMGGGSGAPIFYNPNKRIIGTISGGPNYNCNSNLKHDWAGKLRSCMNYSDGMRNALFGDSGLSTVEGIDRNQSCQDNLSLSGNFYSAEDYDNSLNELTIQAANQITITNATFKPGSNYTISAGTKIVIGRGTKIQSNFHAKISDCSTNLLLCENDAKSIIIANHTNRSSEQSDNIEDIQSQPLNNIKIYPNPNNGSFYIDVFDNSEIKNVIIYDLSGRKVLEKTGNINKMSIPNVQKGMYFVEIQLESNTVFEKIIIE